MPVYDLTKESHLAYAKTCSADYACITKAYVGLPSPVSDRHQMHTGFTYNKIAAIKAHSQYSIVAYIDADVFIRPGSPNVFCSPSLGSAHFLARNEFDLGGNVQDAIGAVNKHTSTSPKWKKNRYYNTGVMIAKAAFINRLQIPQKLFTGHWSEQTYINWFLNYHKIRCADLDKRFNYMPVADAGEMMEDSWFIHFAGTSSPGVSETGEPLANDQQMRVTFMKKYLDRLESNKDLHMEN